METIKYTAAGAKRFYKVRLDQLKTQDNKNDQDARTGLIQGEDGFQAAYVEQQDSFAFVARQGQKLEWGVYTPDGPVQAGNLDPKGESTMESNIRASGLSSGRHSDYEEVSGYAVNDERTQKFAARKSAVFNAALDEAFVAGQLSPELLK